MPAGLPVVLALFAQAATAAASAPASQPAGPAPPLAAKPAAPVKPSRECATPAVPNPNSREIVICAVRPQGYRLDPDVLAARRLKKQGDAGRPHSPHETYVDHSCGRVGPMGCRGQPTIDVIQAATALATMADRLSKGQEIGGMFQTQPTSSEYQLYLQAKRQREEEEANKAAKAKAAAAQAAAAATPVQH
jgi:hypothetical protein